MQRSYLCVKGSGLSVVDRVDREKTDEHTKKLFCMLKCYARKYYGHLCLWLIVSVYVLVLAGGLVRSLEAGMGCPDWPKCYGRWIPPTQESQLPLDYRHQYYAARKAKNFRLAALIEAAGWAATAQSIREEAKVFRSDRFDLLKAWVEYLNRLLGAWVGILGLLFAGVGVVGFRLKRHRALAWLSVATLLGIVMAGLLGALVVATHLLAFTVTIHMGVAFLVIACLVIAYRRWRGYRQAASMRRICIGSGLRRYVWVLFVVFLMQVLWGTQVREAVDRSLLQLMPRDRVLDAQGWVFYVHRSASVGLFFAQVLLSYLMSRASIDRKALRLAWGITATYAVEILLGALLYYLTLAASIQPLHLLVAFVAYGLQISLLQSSGSRH